MKKAKTNLTIDPKVKRNGERLAKKSGLSLSAYITQLILRECAIADGRIKGNLAIFTKTNKK